MCRAFADFYASEHRRLVVFLMAYGASYHAAENAMQDAFADAWSLVRREQWEKVEEPAAWIRRVGINKLRRPNGRRKTVDEISVAMVADSQELGDGVEELTVGTLRVMEALGSLPGPLRAVIVFTMDGFSSSEIASQLGMSPQQVRDMRKKARKLLCARFDGEAKEASQ